MIDGFLFALTLLVALGRGVVSGNFYAFSSFVMKALTRLLPAQGNAAMQSINVAVINPWFLTAFLGTAAACELTVPDRFVHVPANMPQGGLFNVGQMYSLFAEAIRTGQRDLPTFDTAVGLHRFIDTIKQASDTGRELTVA